MSQTQRPYPVLPHLNLFFHRCRSDMDYTNLVMTPAQCQKFDKHIVSTRIRAGRSVDTLALPPSPDRKQRRTVEYLLTNALAGMQGT